jgi:tetratricopeptide (TPR) repeat protein
MTEDIRLSISEADYIASHEPTPEKDQTLFDWILLLFYADKESPIRGIYRLMNETFLAYNEIIALNDKDLHVSFTKNRSGVYSEEIENSIDGLIFENHLKLQEGDISVENYLKLQEGDISVESTNKLVNIDQAKMFIADAGIKYTENEDLKDSRRQFQENLRDIRERWDNHNIDRLIDQVHTEYPYYCFVSSTKAREWNTKGVTTLKEKRYDDAIMYFNKSLALRPHTNHIPWKNKGWCLYKLEKFKEAVECEDNALEINPRDAETWKIRGECFISLTRYDDAMKCIDKALEIDPKYSNSWSSKGFIHSLLGKNEEAIEAYDKALGIDPNSANTLYLRATSRMKANDKKRALSDLEKAIKIGGKKYREHAKQDKDFENIRNDKDFEAILGRDH